MYKIDIDRNPLTVEKFETEFVTKVEARLAKFIFYKHRETLEEYLGIDVDRIKRKIEKYK